MTQALATNTDAPIQKTDDKTPAAERLLVHDNSAFSNLLDSTRFDHMWRIAKMFSSSDMVPQHFHGKPANCFIITQMAVRLEIDPFMLMQNTYVVKGRPGMEAKLAIALVNARGPFTGPIQYALSGEGGTRACRAYATHKMTREVCEQTVTVQMAKAEGWYEKNPKWKNLTDLMLCYRAAMFLARLYAPECLMGMQATDEIVDVAGEQASETAMLPEAGRREFGKPPTHLTSDEMEDAARRSASLDAEMGEASGQCVREVADELQRQQAEKGGQRSVYAHRFDELGKLVMRSMPGIEPDEAANVVKAWLVKSDDREKILKSKVTGRWDAMYEDAEAEWPAAEGAPA